MEFEENTRNILDSQIKSWKEEEKISKTLLTNTNYVDWLVNFINEKGSFKDNDWIDYPKEIKEEDRKNVDNLYLFYRVLSNYAHKIKKERMYGEELIGFVYNRTKYIIKPVHFQGDYYYCSKVDLKFKARNNINLDELFDSNKNEQTL